MALISCPDCGQPVSESAAACIHCGRPMRSAAQPMRHDEEETTLIEQSAKRFKLEQVIAVVLFCIGIIVLIANGGFENQGPAVFGALLLVAGAAIMVHAKFSTWWHHG